MNSEPTVIGLTQYQCQLLASARRAITAKFSADGLAPTALKALLADLLAAAKGEVVITTDLLPKLRESDTAREAIGVGQAAAVMGMSARAVRQALAEGRVSGRQGSAHSRWLVFADSALDYALKQVI
jgi:hypothetical protein